MRYAYELKAWLDRMTPAQLDLPIHVDGYCEFDIGVLTGGIGGPCVEIDAVTDEDGTHLDDMLNDQTVDDEWV